MKKIRRTDPIYRVSYTYIISCAEGKTSCDLNTLDKAIDYMNRRKSQGAGKDFTIEKVVTTYEVIASG